ncbi:hypothetical protein GUJ93_ZPchr0011g28066 [Zizania palustris]|uniref:Uncharacterized protein n=1 Tax=Zizania palustris TaxID=103762 RepID=A0A8J5WJN5_ZIZPA|nr:hypothetical protein GUJ93_ZPchr0011g28066 [Zizania palustris]
MASIFKARRRRSPDDDGEEDRSAFGRVTRRCLSLEKGALVPTKASTMARVARMESSPGWLSNLLSGARRVITSVLFFSPEKYACIVIYYDIKNYEFLCESLNDIVFYM